MSTNELILYHNDMSVCAAKVRMALAEKKIPWTGVHMNLRAGDTHKPDYVKLNPNRVVPTLVHNGMPIIESNVICEYIEDVWPNAPLRPASPRNRAHMRAWMRQLDDGIHVATAVVSLCIAFRIQHLKRNPDEFKAWLSALDPARRERTLAAVEMGIDAPQFAPAVYRFAKLADDMDAALSIGAWLAGDAFSLADIAYAPYMARLMHLGLDDMIIARPHVAEWRERLFARPAYKSEIEGWFNPNYLDIFATKSTEAREAARRILRLNTLI
jgi:glutathione S-transferase